MMEIYSQKSVEVSTVNFCLWVILLLIETYFFCLDAYELDICLVEHSIYLPHILAVIKDHYNLDLIMQKGD